MVPGSPVYAPNHPASRGPVLQRPHSVLPVLSRTVTVTPCGSRSRFDDPLPTYRLGDVQHAMIEMTPIIGTKMTPGFPHGTAAFALSRD